MMPPTHAAEYDGKTIDGRKLPAKVYSSATGGVFEAQVKFQRDWATIYFVNGGQLVIRLSQPIIRDPNNIIGYGQVGQLPLGRSLSIGIGADPALNGSVTAGGGTLADLWTIRLLPETP
ncbi:hypothetical protein NIES2104_65290 [Leptolyngbya sp. NIES-2104]|nr:hypothetical protein NIES2104_65290 [Leptolyngbya sp. NIES-2104]